MIACAEFCLYVMIACAEFLVLKSCLFVLFPEILQSRRSTVGKNTFLFLTFREIRDKAGKGQRAGG